MDNNKNMTPYITALQAVFLPAVDASQATHWFTTDEIFSEIQQINPGTDVSRIDVHNALLAAGYRYRQRPGTLGCDFRWMLRSR